MRDGYSIESEILMHSKLEEWISKLDAVVEQCPVEYHTMMFNDDRQHIALVTEKYQGDPSMIHEDDPGVIAILPFSMHR